MNPDALKQALRTYICTELLNNPKLQLGDDVRLVADGYLDSFALTQISNFVEQQYQIVVDMAELADLADNGRDTLAEIVGLVLAKAGRA